jgi:hypothetical protein
MGDVRMNKSLAVIRPDIENFVKRVQDGQKGLYYYMLVDLREMECSGVHTAADSYFEVRDGREIIGAYGRSIRDKEEYIATVMQTLSWDLMDME